MLYYLGIFVVAALFGFIFGSRQYLKRLAAVLYQTKAIPAEQVDKLVEVIRTYNKIQRQARKATREAYKKSVVDSQLEKMKKEVEK